MWAKVLACARALEARWECSSRWVQVLPYESASGRGSRSAAGVDVGAGVLVDVGAMVGVGNGVGIGVGSGVGVGTVWVHPTTMRKVRRHKTSAVQCKISFEFGIVSVKEKGDECVYGVMSQV